MFDYISHFENLIDGLKADGRYRTFATLQRKAGKFPVAEYTATDGSKKDVTIWCSNDYLGMGQKHVVMDAMYDAIQKSGCGAGGTRNISGTTIYHRELEKSVADLHNKEAGLVFSSGYVSNEGSLSTLGKLLPDCVIFSDELNHASMIHGIRGSKSEKYVFRHNDIDHQTQNYCI